MFLIFFNLKCRLCLNFFTSEKNCNNCYNLKIPPKKEKEKSKHVLNSIKETSGTRTRTLCSTDMEKVEMHMLTGGFSIRAVSV